MERRKKTKDRGGALRLAPEAEARLAEQVDAVAAGLKSGAEVAALREHLTPDPDDPQWDVRLMAALAELRHPAIPELLAALFGEARDKVRRKALKRTLHLLKTRGVDVPPDLLPRETATVGAPRPGTTVAHMTPIFGDGESYIILEGPPEILGGNFLVSLINDREGFRECMLLNIRRKQQADFWEHFHQQGVPDLFSPPPEYAVAVLEGAYTAHPESPGASQYGALRDRIFQHWGRPEDAPDLEEVLPDLHPGEQARLLEQARQVAVDPLFHSWMPGPDEIAPWLAKVEEVEDSPLILSDQQKQVRVDAVLDEATRALYPLETRSAWSRRLKTTAYYLHLWGRPEDSRAAQAAALDLAEPDRGSLTAENPLLKSLVELALQLAWQARHPQEPETSSGLVTPPEEGLLIRK